MLTLLVSGSIWFWALVILASMLMVWALESESGILATFIFLVAGTLMLVLGNWSWAEWLITNPFHFIGGIAAYLVIGVIWSIVKWWFYVRKVAKKYLDVRRVCLIGLRDSAPTEMEKIPYNDALKTGHLDTKLKKEWASFILRHYYESIKRPIASENKDRIIGWTAYWPWSFLWTLINDSIKRFFNWLYSKLSKIYQKISDNAFKDLA